MGLTSSVAYVGRARQMASNEGNRPGVRVETAVTKAREIAQPCGRAAVTKSQLNAAGRVGLNLPTPQGNLDPRISVWRWMHAHEKHLTSELLNGGNSFQA